MLDNLTTDRRSVLKRFVGTSLSRAPLTALIPFFSLVDCPPDGWSKELEACFFVACFMSAYDIYENGKTPVENVLKTIYKKKETSDSTKHKIEMLFDKKMDVRASNIKALSWIISVADNKTLKNIDVVKLLHDLKYWDSTEPLNSQKAKWAKKVICQEKDANFPK